MRISRHSTSLTATWKHSWDQSTANNVGLVPSDVGPLRSKSKVAQHALFRPSNAMHSAMSWDGGHSNRAGKVAIAELSGSAEMGAPMGAR